jgi:GTP-binding protein Era
MTSIEEEPTTTEYSDLEGSLLADDTLPPDHRSGFVAVIGRPNVGKSTLMNHYLGQKIAIVSPKPQTTRNRLLGILTLPSELQPELSLQNPPAQIVFIDTPGIHAPHHKLGEFLVDTALEAIPDADLLLWLVDASKPPTVEDRLVAEAISDAQTALAQQGEADIPVILGLNKTDLLGPGQLAGLEAPFLALYPAAEWLPFSATQGYNRDELLHRIIKRLPVGPRYFPEEQITDQQTRFIAAELIREAALEVLRQEVPHALAVFVTEFKRRHANMTYIGATLILERQSHKKIVIGEKGRTLREIGRQARPQIEELVGSKIYLDLWVKVRPQWRKKEAELEWLGYTKAR